MEDSISPTDGLSDSTIPSSVETESPDTLPESITDDEIRLIAREGKGALYEQNGNKILVIRGMPYEMGYQHGVLLKESVHIVAQKVIEESERLKPGYLRTIWEQQKDWIPDRYKEELKGLAEGADLSEEEIQLANIMPELFHCSGIVIFGEATDDGGLLHARILDYIVDYGLQDHSVVIIAQPDGYNAFMNASFSGFIGSVTGLNDKQIAVGEMGGGGEGLWDGIPMSLLVRMVLEETESLEESVGIFNNNPRTCEYYYVISDGKAKDAVALYATPDILQALKPGESHPLLPIPLKQDTLIISGADRYTTIHERINENYGKVNKDMLIEIMKRPVSMHGNLHNAIFQPETLTMWLAVAMHPDEPNFQACYQIYYEYNLMELLELE